MRRSDRVWCVDRGSWVGEVAKKKKKKKSSSAISSRLCLFACFFLLVWSRPKERACVDDCRRRRRGFQVRAAYTAQHLPKEKKEREKKKRSMWTCTVVCQVKGRNTKDTSLKPAATGWAGPGGMTVTTDDDGWVGWGFRRNGDEMAWHGNGRQQQRPWHDGGRLPSNNFGEKEHGRRPAQVRLS